MSLASAVVKAWVVTEPSMPPPPVATNASTLAALASGISEITRKSYWPSVKYSDTSYPPACSQSLEMAACLSSGRANPPLMYSRVNRPWVNEHRHDNPPVFWASAHLRRGE